MNCANAAELIEMPFGMLSGVGPGNHVLDGGAHCRNLANTTESFVCAGDAALCRITLTTCCHYGITTVVI